MCLTPFLCKNNLNSMLVKVGPLSDTTFSGIPNCAKILCKHWIVADTVIRDNRMYFYPFGMWVNQNEKHMIQEWTCKINMNSSPRSTRPFPWHQWCHRRIRANFLTFSAIFLLCLQYPALFLATTQTCGLISSYKFLQDDHHVTHAIPLFYQI